MRERPAAEGGSGMGRRLRCAALRRGFASPRRRWGKEQEWCVRRKMQPGSRQIGWRMALYLGGKISVSTNDLPPKEATQMSHDVKYIGMDVHKEAIVIAVLNGSGKLVMETILETKASSILQFIHGLRGELHVTWEEGTWAAWLYDLLQPQVHEILVCNPRRNALVKEGSKSDKVDARKLACAAARSCSTNSWMDYRPCGETCDPSFWPRAGNIRQRSCCARFPASVRFEQPT